MFLFMVLLFPTVLAFCCVHSDKKIYGFLIACGAFLGILVSGFTAAFSYMHRIPEYSFFSNFFYYFFKQYALPLILVYALYFFITKDSYEFRVKAFFPFVTSFFAIYMPYCIIASATSSVEFSFYILFIKPVEMLSMIFLCSLIAYKIYCATLEKKVKTIVLYSIFALLVLALPAILETLWLMCIALPFVYIAAVCYGFVALILFFVNSRQNAKFLF